MKIECTKNHLLHYINIVSKAVSSKTTLPILECILLSAKQGQFKMMATDLEIGIETAPIESTILEDGQVALEAKLFSEIIRKLPDDTIIIESDDKCITKIQCQRSDYKIVGQPGDEFPELPSIAKESAFTVKQNDFKNIIKQTIFSISTEESKPVLTGELIELKDNALHMVSVDGFRISYAEMSMDTNDVNTSFIVPGKTLQEINKLLSNDEDANMSFFCTENHVLFELADCVVISRLLNGEFLKYEQSFISDYQTIVTISRNDFLAALERASLLSRDVKKNPVELKVCNENMAITSRTDMGTAFEEVTHSLEGQEIEIAFNPRYLIEALRVIEEDQIQLQFNNPLSPCIIKPLESSHCKYLVLPLRLK